jgi:hypothetical protein
MYKHLNYQGLACPLCRTYGAGVPMSVREGVAAVWLTFSCQLLTLLPDYTALREPHAYHRHFTSP